MVLAVFGAGVLLLAAVFAVVLTDSVPLMVVFGAGFVASCFNVYWVWQRLRHER
ncbi:hypothetical protein HNR23_004138 [Nocardiopsis mwathae]|uniref:Uncharacterized protein n=2 Tax=Nocardiopsis mwathae TaxID=1472723 RepID=A0A7X0D750_9ACTN|nr:hypothetical protein [Nocardiopsis mwathae]